MSEAIRSRSNAWKALVALVLAVVMGLGTVTPSRADQAAVNRNVILGAAAIVAGIILYNNWQHKMLAHNTVVGYTPNGGVVYADGRVVYPNGTTYYMSNNGQAPCDYDNDGDAPMCGPYAGAYTWRPAPPGYSWNRGHHYAFGRRGDRDDERFVEDRDDEQSFSAPRTVFPRTVFPRTVSPRTVAPRTVVPRSVTRDRDDRQGRDDHGRRDRR